VKLGIMEVGHVMEAAGTVVVVVVVRKGIFTYV